jgi:hypothetical protein
MGVHNWKKMKEPNELNYSFKYCPWCDTPARFNMHGHWMFGWEFVSGIFEKEVIDEWIKNDFK